MRTPLRVVALACCVLAGLWAAGAAVAADPPPIDDFPAGTRLSSRQAQQMRARITYWVRAIRDAKTDAEAVKARDGLIRDANDMEAKGAGFDFAKQAAEEANWPLLRKAMERDSLRTVKEVNLASALSQMPQVSIQPALEAMVADTRNPAVRYLGWKGYRAVRMSLFMQGLPWAERTLAGVEKAARTETSSAVLEQVFRMLEMDAAKPDAVTKQVWDLAQNRMWAILSANWRSWCMRVLAGEDDVAEASQRAAAAVLSHLPWVEQDKAQKKNLLQMLVDLAFCAGQAFVQTKSETKPGEAFAGLLRFCEAALNGVTKQAKKFIDKPLSDPKSNTAPQMVIFDPSTKENSGVLGWVEFLKDQGVMEPKFNRPSPASAPAGGAAPAPATRP